MPSEASKRPVFDLEGQPALSNDDTYTRRDAPTGQLALAGPSRKFAAGHVPVRGDLAHVRLAGICFVPHYAVPMPHRAGPKGAVLRIAPASDAETLYTLAPGDGFDVLDISGGWCWGEAGEEGPVGYVEQAALEVAAP
jgi:hypothetical protein